MIHHVNIIRLIQEMQSMCNENAGPVSKWSSKKAVVENTLSYIGIYSRERIIEKNNIRLRIRGAGK